MGSHCWLIMEERRMQLHFEDIFFLTKKMANKISVLLSMSMTLMVDCQINQIRHVQEGDGYKIIQESRQEKSVQTLCNEIPKEKLQNCYREDGDEKCFFQPSRLCRKCSSCGQPRKLLRLHPTVLRSKCTTEQYADKPFKILGFPCNQFLGQEPGANAREIFSVLRHVRPGDDFVPNFEMFAKTEVNGKNENPIYTFLKSRCPSVRKEFQAPYKLYYDPYHQDDIRWNFEKFLLDHRGQPIRRYDESLDPSEIVPDIDALINNIENDDGLSK